MIFWIEFSWNNFELNKLLNWIFMIQLWIEYWIESILGKIQTLNWINLGIEQGYAPLKVILVREDLIWNCLWWKNNGCGGIVKYILVTSDFTLKLELLMPHKLGKIVTKNLNSLFFSQTINLEGFHFMRTLIFIIWFYPQS